jgi:hypothetical protein
MSDGLFILILFVILATAFAAGEVVNNGTNRSWERDLAKSGHARYVINQTTGESTWQLLPPATRPANPDRE